MENVFDISEMYEISRKNDIKKIIDNIQPITHRTNVKDEYQSFEQLVSLLYPDPTSIPPEVIRIKDNLQILVQSYEVEEKVIDDLNEEIRQKQDTIAMLKTLNQPTP